MMSLTLDRIRKKWETEGVLKRGQQFGLCGVYGKGVVADDSNRVLTFIVNTDDVDADQEIVVPGGLNFDMLKRNGKIFLDHWYDLDHTVGAFRHAKAFPDTRHIRGWTMATYILKGMKSSYADDVLTAAREIGIGASIGFIPKIIEPPNERDPERYKAARSIIREADVFEISLTMLPCNVSCQQVKDVDESQENAPMLASIGRLVTKKMINAASAKAFGWQEPLPLTLEPRRPPMKLAV